jgi:hypothetical protein
MAVTFETHPYLKPLLESELGEVSKKQYVRQLKKIMETCGYDSVDDVLQNPVSAVRRLDQLQFSPSSKKAMVSSVCAVLKYNDDLQMRYPVEKKTWSEALREINKKEMERVSTAQPTQREMMNWVPWNDVLKKQRELHQTEYGSDRHLLLSLYTLIEPVRSDYGDVHVRIEDQSCDDLDKAGENYVKLSATSGASHMVLNKYKTHSKYGRFFRNIPDELVRIIAHNLEEAPREYLIIDTAGYPYTKSNSFNRYVNRTLYELFGKHITISLLRHSFISNIDFNKKTPAELMQISKNMQHSLGMQQLYRRHVPEFSVSLDEATSSSQQQQAMPSSETIREHMMALAAEEARLAMQEASQERQYRVSEDMKKKRREIERQHMDGDKNTYKKEKHKHKKKDKKKDTTKKKDLTKSSTTGKGGGRVIYI